MHPRANVRMQFGAEHSSVPFSTNANDSAKIDGETHLGIEVPRSGDHRNILLHKVGTYLAVVMKALAKTVEPPQTLDGSSTHLDFHVDAEFKEPQAHVTITEKHPAEIVLQTLWTGDPQPSENIRDPTEISGTSSCQNGPVLGSINSEHLDTVVGTQPTTSGTLSILNLSPLVSHLGLPSQNNKNFDLTPNNVGVSENELGLSLNLFPTNQIIGSIGPSIQNSIEGPLSNTLNNVLQPDTVEKLSPNRNSGNDYSLSNELNSHIETENKKTN